MRCFACQHDNAAGSRSCSQCGAPFGGSCAACAAALAPSARFCSKCGARTDAAEPATPIARDGPAPDYARLGGDEPAAAQRSVGERRQLTAMFCDLVGFTALSRELDPEELGDLLTDYQQVCSEAIVRFDGHIAQYLGDGVLAYFGYPQAHEDSADRAVRAGLAIQASLTELNRRRSAKGSKGISMRVGIHTGLVVVTEMGDEAHQETLALGDTITIASRIQGFADTGDVLISDATLRLVPGLFVTRDLGTPYLKGVTDPVGVHMVIGRAGVGLRFAPSGPLTPLVGRALELGQFLVCWEQVEEGNGQVIAVSGEAGIGKSRLLHAFHEQLAKTPHFTLTFSCSPYTAGSAFQPVIQLYELGLGLEEEDAPDERLAKLEQGLSGLPGLSLSETIPFIAALLDLPESERFPLEDMSPELQRERTLEALLASILALASQQPLVVACEDLHWCDPSSLELFGRLIDRVSTLPALVVLTFRPAFTPPWSLARPHVSPFALSRLTERNTRQVIEAAVGHAVPERLLARLVERADGVPLFAEELGRAVVDSGIAGSDTRDWRETVDGDPAIPATLKDSLMERLDRLSAAKPVAQLASILGHEFAYPLIAALSDVDADTLRDGLEQLVEAKILYQRGVVPEANYTFKHALLQETAYESQLRSRRRELHARVSRILEEHFPQRIAAAPEVMARHCAAGQLIPQAVSYYQQAAEQAVTRLSDSEAVEYFSRAVELHLSLPRDDARDQREIELRLARNGPLSALGGYDDPEVVASCDRIDELCSSIEKGPKRLVALHGLMLFHVNRGYLPKAKEYAESMLEIVEPLGMPALEVAGQMIKGTASITSAPVTEALTNLEKAIEVARSAELPPPKAVFDIDALTVAHSTHAIALAIAGKPESALESAERALRRARELGHNRTYASALVNVSLVTFHLRSVERTLSLTEECLKLVDGRGFHSVELSARVRAGWARTRMGDPDGVRQVEEALEFAGTIGAVGGITQHYFAAADTYTIVGRYDDALAAVAHGARLIESTGETRGYGPTVPSTRARIALAQGTQAPERIEELLLEASGLWRRSGARWLEIEMAIMLGQLALQTGRQAEARILLEAVYAGFTEGFDTPRLIEARAVLDELS